MTCVLKKFIAVIKCQFDKNVNVVRSDNRSKFVCLKQYFENFEILH